jgi:hypothetical protein
MKKCAFVPVDDKLYYPEGTHLMVNSFKRFHPDIDLIVFRQDVIDTLFKEESINFYQAKPFFAELLMHDYDLVVNIDADTIFLDRLTEVFDNVDYDIGAAWNFNDYENASFANITEKMYLQAGMVGSTSKEFWLAWQEINRGAMQYLRKENDTLNLLAYNDPEMQKLRLKIFDEKKDYYGCKSLGREPQFEIKDGKTFCRGEQVKAYHFARGNHFPKLDIANMPLQDAVKENWREIATYGQSYTMTGIKGLLPDIYRGEKIPYEKK